ncbi:unnamed protein product, partial [Darwinula stevensoni]
MVHQQNLYYLQDATQWQEFVPITRNADSLGVYNGIPDLAYEGESNVILLRYQLIKLQKHSFFFSEDLFQQDHTIWMTEDGKRLVYLSIDDRELPLIQIPKLGSMEVPTEESIKKIRYPKASLGHWDHVVRIKPPLRRLEQQEFHPILSHVLRPPSVALPNRSIRRHLMRVNVDTLKIECLTCNIRRDPGEGNATVESTCESTRSYLNPSSTRVVVECRGPSIPFVRLYDVPWPGELEEVRTLEDHGVLKNLTEGMVWPEREFLSVRLHSNNFARVSLFFPPIHPLNRDEDRRFSLVIRMWVLERHPEVNRSQVGVWGWGIPGYTALSTLTPTSFPSSDVKCAFAVAPPSDWKHFS